MRYIILRLFYFLLFIGSIPYTCLSQEGRVQIGIWEGEVAGSLLQIEIDRDSLSELMAYTSFVTNAIDSVETQVSLEADSLVLTCNLMGQTIEILTDLGRIR